MSRKELPLLNKTLAEAADILNDAGHSFRIVKRDGVPYVVTCDHNINRCNLTLLNGKVAEYKWG